jgi:hypothetical protein
VKVFPRSTPAQPSDSLFKTDKAFPLIAVVELYAHSGNRKAPGVELSFLTVLLPKVPDYKRNASFGRSWPLESGGMLVSDWDAWE